MAYKILQNRQILKGTSHRSMKYSDKLIFQIFIVYNLDFVERIEKMLSISTFCEKASISVIKVLSIKVLICFLHYDKINNMLCMTFCTHLMPIYILVLRLETLLITV